MDNISVENGYFIVFELKNGSIWTWGDYANDVDEFIEKFWKIHDKDRTIIKRFLCLDQDCKNGQPIYPPIRLDDHKRLNYKISNSSETFSSKDRWKIMQRDGFRCVKCGRTSKDGIKLHVDHIFPRSKGGMATLENGQTLCEDCNIGKGARISS